MKRLLIPLVCLTALACEDSRSTRPGGSQAGGGDDGGESLDAPQGGDAGGNEGDAGGPGGHEGQDEQADEAAEGAGADGGAEAAEGAEGDEAGGPGEGGDDDCAEGQRRCSEAGLPQQCSDGNWLDAFPCDDSFACIDGFCRRVEECEPGVVDGCVDDQNQRVCADTGRGYGPRQCPEDAPLCFRGSCGHQICEPEDRRCRGNFTIELCGQDGTRWSGVDSCDPQDDEVCLRGECVRGCAVAAKSQSYLGCEFWSVDLPQFHDLPPNHPDEAPHAVVIANTGDRPALVTIETRSGAVVPRPVNVPPGDTRTVPFPRLDVDGTGRTLNSFRLTTTEPVIAYQFNPLNNVNVHSNDASLLLPSNAIGQEYLVMSWPGGVPLDMLGMGAQTAWFTIVATAPGTTNLRLTFSCDIIDGGEFEGISRGDSLDVEMEQWEVLNFEAQTDLMGALRGEVGDVTGSRVQSDQPVVVFAGHKEAVIGEDGEDGSNCCADHLEQQMFPVPAWGQRYLAVHSPPRGTEPDYWRVLASEADTVLTTVPVIDGLHGRTLGAGEFVEANTRESFEITATHPILVGQFLASQASAGVETLTGDPAFLLAVPVEQFRSEYGALTPESYARDYVSVIKPAAAVVDLDGRELPADDFTPFGAGDWVFLHVEVEPGTHILTSRDDEPFAVNMYGYDGAVSYGYPGGLDLRRADDRQ